jgi:NADH-quinone oxidoreductase subunit I
MLCARECPDWCIYIDSHKETLPATTEGGRERSRNVLDRFAIDFSLCMYCGICIDVCPFDALHWSPEFEYAEADIRDLLHEKDRLGQWMQTVPPPPALDPGSAEPAEVAAASRPARGGLRERPAARERAAPGAGPRERGASGTARQERVAPDDAPATTGAGEVTATEIGAARPGAVERTTASLSDAAPTERLPTTQHSPAEPDPGREDTEG